MSQQINQSSELKSFHWLDLVEIVSVVSSVGGSLLAIVLQQTALSSIPLSICVAVNLCNRNRLLKAQDTQKAIAILTAQIQENHINLDQAFNQISTVEQSIANLNTDTQKLQEQDENVEQQIQQLTELVKKLEKIQILSKAMAVGGSSEDFSELAHHCQNIGELSKARELYTEAIKHNHRNANAYQQRGVIRSELDDKQGAIQDFRMAAKLYFEQEDLENYQQAKDLCNKLYELEDSNQDKDSEPVILGKLFS
ncbi:Tetratricopeptide TPR_1 repeat-containing protein [Stanieria cyanosphaera PCC 7437]|uniref:Tetratricopeptide TPR_1 repeat-containing protein n=1 Tax=Stanieria cyanosphaera (strain ATCC 29371 / PCC 7437) TaxID=111780 RepID=K9XYL0_STAC7|nr:tetratricopeptide repeat protein [Stanieria cyanosphaera]AFZ37114.1 Tetratricopeptide TPR_1 repeat-containing protein [Stanieria cyanosphaera PCC 7437]